MAAAPEHGIAVLRVPAYSPYAVDRFGVALLLALVRKTYRLYARVRDGNFSAEGLMGFKLHGRTLGSDWNGQDRAAVRARHARLRGTGVLGYDVHECAEAVAMAMVVEYTALDRLLADSHVVSDHCPLLPSTRRIINREALSKMRGDAMLINESRGQLMDAKAVWTH